MTESITPKVTPPEPVIRVSDVSKCYHIYERPSLRLMQGVVGRARKFYKEFWALSGVSLEVSRGETIAIVGRNGSGKSTLLQVIVGTLQPTQGHVAVNGRVAALLELGSGFNPEFTGRENVYLNASILGLTKAQIDDRLQSIIDFADIGDFIDRTVKSYSSGMVMRLAFAVMAHVDADILIIDEALAVGDAFFTQKCMRFLREFQARGTLLFVSHDPGAVTGLCEKAVWLDAGKLVGIGPSKEIMAAYTEAFIAHREGRVSAPLVTGTRPVSKVKADARKELIDRTTLRNDIVIPSFEPGQAGFGDGGVAITNVEILDQNSVATQVITGGELVLLQITAKANRDLQSPIVGFYLKDRLGQLLFGDNTYLSYRENPLRVEQGRELRASFAFTMPRLQPGDYFITAGVAEGSQDEHFIQHWIHEALQLKSVGSSSPAGLIGIQMQDIELKEVGR